MNFDPTGFGPQAAALLALDGDGARLMPLTSGPAAKESPAASELRTRLNPRGLDVLDHSAALSQDLFPSARVPDAALAGLWLYFSCFDEAHQLADACHRQEGYWWHGIVHRQEPDYWNASYWWRRAFGGEVADHPVADELARIASAIAAESGLDAVRTISENGRWHPTRFNAVCEQAVKDPGSPLELAARRIQLAEWQLLFHHCAAPATASAPLDKSAAHTQRTAH